MLICLTAFLLRSEGILWPKLHPDEHPIGNWIERTAHSGYIADKVYANGFFVLARPVQCAARAWQYIRHQMAYHVGAAEQPPEPAFVSILFARWFNVWLGTLTCLFLYGLVARISGSGPAGLWAAALWAWAQYPVEHSHYGETDIAMVFMLTAALWLWAEGSARRSWPWLGAAAITSGFAAGTKFPLMILYGLVLVLGLMHGRRTTTRARALALGLVCVVIGTGLFLWGFIIANPLVVKDWAGFQAGLDWEQRRVYHEPVLNLGLLHAQPYLKNFLHIKSLWQMFQTLGWGWMLLALVGLPCAWLKPYRRFWPVLLLFPALYAFYWIVTAPWVRTQEFMNYLPVLAAWAALPLVILWQGRHRAWRWLVLVLACVALLLNAWNGWRVAALFGWPDTRLLACTWLEEHLPAEAVLASERYAEAACPSEQQSIMIYKVERDGRGPLQAQGADYLLRSATIAGRGLQHPLTGQRYPEPQRRFDDFLEHSERLGAWGTRAPDQLATFLSPTIELWGLRRFYPQQVLNLELAQPLFLSNAHQSETGQQTFWPIGHKLGSATGLLIDRYPRMIAIGGPSNAPAPVYLLLNTQERGAQVQVRGYGQRRTVSLAPYALAVVPLARAGELFSSQPFERITLRAVSVRGITYIPCYARVAFSPAEVARLCCDLGRPEAFWQCFTDADLVGLPEALQRYQLAVCAGRWDLAEQLVAVAEKASGALPAARRAEPASLRLNDNSGYYYNELARLRLQPSSQQSLWRDAFSRERFQKRVLVDRISLAATPAAEPGAYQGALVLPVRLASGQYELRGEWLARAGLTSQPATITIEGSLLTQTIWQVSLPSNAPAAWTAFTLPLTAHTEFQPHIMLRAAAPLQLYLRNLELHWSLGSALESKQRAWALARAAHALQRGQSALALAILEHQGAGYVAQDIELHQLRFQALQGVLEPGAPQLAAAARNVLALAPADYRCLKLLAETDPGSRLKAEALTGNLAAPLICGRFLALVGCAFDPQTRELSCLVEILENETPPLALALWERKQGTWRKRQSAALSSRPRLQRGERVALVIKLNERFGPVLNVHAIGLGVETDVEWHPGALPLAGHHLDVLSLSSIPGLADGN
ncbi:MAG: phospholipid carrier-dependent glycosyltransferase, partial [Lentisphaerae bacterium]|nr:phospholipid carrier-dependent glycosyltransferase [Lentisphaerota bacterium]